MPGASKYIDSKIQRFKEELSEDTQEEMQKDAGQTFTILHVNMNST